MPITIYYSGLGEEPQVAGAEALGRRTVRVDFSEVMRNDAALVLAANYVITPAGGSDARTVTAVATMTPSSVTSVILTLDGDLTPGTNNYTVEVSNVADQVGNPIDTANDTATFSGPAAFTPLEVNSDGGEFVEFELGLSDGDYYVDVGTAPASSAVRAYSGISGAGTSARSDDGIIGFVVPRLEPAEDYRILVTPVAGGASVTSDPLFHARRRPIFGATHSLRKSLPEAYWLVGPSTPEAEEVA